jgi:hypothetical protein
MSKQITLTKKEKKEIPLLLMSIGEILIRKMDDGVEAPQLEGTFEITNMGVKISFDIRAEKSD